MKSLPPETLEELEELTQAVTPRFNKYLTQYMAREPRFPSPTQRAGLLLENTEHLLFGGSAGGGKSSLLLGCALQYVDVPGYSAGLFRRKYTDLRQPDALIPRSHEWLKGTDAHWKGDDMQWVFPSGAVLKFGYMDGANDHLNYQGAAFQFVGFDESGQMEPYQMEFMQTRSRRLAGSEVPIRFRYTANPGGKAHDWLVQRFLLSTDPNWVFIPSLARDNPGLDVADYVRRLDAISDPVLRAQMRDGDWGAVDRSGLVCPEWTPEIERACCTPDFHVPAYFTAYVGADPGSTDIFAVLLGFVDFIGARLVILDERWYRNPRTDEVGDGVMAMEEAHIGPARKEGRVDATLRYTDIDHRFVADLKAKPWHLNFSPTQKTDADMWDRQLRAAIKMGRVLIHPRCDLLLRTLRHARRKPNGDIERTEGTGHGDAWKALVYLFRNINWGRNPFPAVEEPRAPWAPAKPIARTGAQRAALGLLPSIKPLG